MTITDDHIRAELGSNINPSHIRYLLEKDDASLVAYLVEWAEDFKGILAETQQYVGGTADLGLRIAEDSVRTALFLIHELQARNNAIDPMSDSEPII